MKRLKRKSRIGLVGLFLLFFATTLLAQDRYDVKTSDPLSESWRFTTFKELDGKGVRTIDKSENGTIYWFGVADGLLKYDGYSWEHFGENEGIKGGAVSLIYVDPHDNVFVSTSRGLFKREGKNWKPVFLGGTNETLNFYSIKKLSDGSILCALTNGAVLLSQKGNYYLSSLTISGNFLNNHPDFTLVELPKEVSFNSGFSNISDVLEISPGLIWMAISSDAKGKILEFNISDIQNNSFSKYKIMGKNSHLEFGNDQKLFRASDGKIWIINKSNKIETFTYFNNSWSKISFNRYFGDDEYTVSIAESEDGTIWIGGIGKVFSVVNNKIKKYSSPSYNIPAAHVTVYSEQDGELILMGYLSSILKIDLSNDEWLTYKGLNYQCERGDKNWFLDVYGKVIREDNDEWYSYSTKDGLIDAPVRVFATSQNQIWVVGSHQGKAAVACLNDNKWEKYTLDSLSWGIDYRAVFEAGDHSIFFGGSVDRDPEKGHYGGLVQLINPTEKDKKWVYYKSRERGLNQSNVYGIGQSDDGTIWIGGSRLFGWDNQSWNDSNDDKLRQFINIVTSDENHNLYAGSRYYGLFIYDNIRWTNYSTENGLTSNTIISVSAAHNQIWVATDKDISFFNGQTWINHVFPTEMNLPNEGGSIIIDPQNEIWVNHSLREWKRRAYTGKPISREVADNFLVYRKVPDKAPPQAFIEVYSKVVDNSGNTVIAWNGKDYMNNTPQDRLMFSFRLNDGEWSEFLAKQNHTFTGLTSGDYKFELRAMDLDGNISTIPGFAEFEVSPPVWKQAWFIILIAGFIFMLSIFEYRIIRKNQSLSYLNVNLQEVVDELEIKNKKIETQNQKITKHQEELEENNKLLESKNHEIESQRDALKDLVIQIENLARAKVTFFTNITHEFRTPLSLILGPLESLTRGKISSPEKITFYQLIKRNALRLQKLINQLLEIRRIETGTLELMLRRENVTRYVRDIKELFNNQAIQKHINFSFTSDMDNFEIYFDQDKLEKIIFNLLSNSFKYTPEYGAIKVILTIHNYEKPGTHRYDVDIERFLKIEVKDSGKGIESHRLKNIFERYKNVDESLNITNMQSTGIGLSYIKELIEFHQGKIYLDSEPGKGTTFTIFLPKDLEPKGNKLIADSSIFELNKSIDASIIESEKIVRPEMVFDENKTDKPKTILIIEDNEDMVFFIRSLLENDYQVLSANNGKAGLEILNKEEKIDLIISDLMMPEMNGLEFCEQVKTNFETSHIPVILLTAKSLKEDEISGYESGADDYITKPFDPEVLMLKVKNILLSRENLIEKFSVDFKFKPKDIKVTSADEQLINKLVELMEKHISDTDFDVNKLCDMVNLSHMHFIRKVKQLTGKKPIDLLKSFRMQRAKQLLEQDKLNISEIAYMVGYDLPNSFSRAFKKEFNISPTEFVALKNRKIYLSDN